MATFDFIHVHQCSEHVGSHQWTFGGALTYRYFFEAVPGFMTTARTSPTQYNEIIFQPLKAAKARMETGIKEFEREGQPILVTTVAVSLVDCLALLERGPPLSELMVSPELYAYWPR